MENPLFTERAEEILTRYQQIIIHAAEIVKDLDIETLANEFEDEEEDRAVLRMIESNAVFLMTFVSAYKEE